MIIKDSYIQEQIDKCNCPGFMMCTVATTSYDSHERETICLKCWLNYCKYNHIIIDYGNGVYSND